ncbi:hypothetical protein [Paenibacillus hexagrammi]|uniref:Uncharacterized protein n=1 Tax=Paenibacillus hexagrammi TaxID=2908839 RepID=A0ABY3SU85_9BACL|nr:hypothetical protein [Paenibacillus sp. YPD9-1]UJF36541.1 hypothetical protein L0M14_30605 [Paenibacillus sp. YPD9-1]
MSLPVGNSVRTPAQVAVAVRRRLRESETLTIESITAAVIEELREEYILVVKSR